MRVIATIVGIALAAIGGVIVYRALYLEPSSAVVVTSGGVRELPNTLRVACGVGLLVIGAVLAFFSARKRTS